MKSQEAWDCANMYSTKAVAIATCITQAAAYLIIKDDTSILWAAGLLAIGIVLIMPLTKII